MPAGTTSYWANETNQYGCSLHSVANVTVVPMPVIKAQDTITLCKNGSVQMNLVDSAYSVTWSPATYLSGSHDFSPVSTPAENITYTVTAANQLGCTVTGVVPIKVYGAIPLTVSGDTTVCPGSIVKLNASVDDTFFHDVTYIWGPSSNMNSNNIPNPLATMGQDAETYTVTATSGACPAATASVTVGVNPAASIALPATIVSLPNTEISITPVSGDLSVYHWSAKDQPSCTECATMTLVPTESQTVYLEGENQYGCKTADSMMVITVSCDPASIFVPNIFTPNGDGKNDVLYVRSKTLVEIEYFQIFNRWGAMVFQTTNMSEGWDGSISGKPAEEGTYVYQVKGKCQNGYDISTNGTVSLIK